MPQRHLRVVRRHFDSFLAVASARTVYTAAAVLIIAQLAFRAWALYPSWFYGDDYTLLLRAREGPHIGYLFDPHNGHLMPAGRLLVWLVMESGGLNWGLVATTTLLFQALASGTALWMLLVLFGRRWAILAPLSLYLFGTMTLPALMWWAASLNQISMQTAFFVAVGSWVLYLRGRGKRWLGLTTVAVGFGLAFDVKALLILPVLVFVMFAYFATGGVRRRVMGVLHEYWLSAVVLGTTTTAYVVYYMLSVDAPFTSVTLAAAARTASKMLGTGFVTAAVGGPWNWDASEAPNARVDPPAVAVHLAWVAAALVILYAAFRRRRSMRAWAMLSAYLLFLLALLVTGRVEAYGADIGLQYRFLTDAACMLALAVGLAYLPLIGAKESSAARSDPVLRYVMPAIVTTGIIGLVLASSVISSIRYVAIWHDQNPSYAYSQNLEDGLRIVGRVDLVDDPVPKTVVDPLAAPQNELSRFVTFFPNKARFPDASPDLHVVDEQGRVRPALIKQALTSSEGPEPNCGWRISSGERRIPLTSRALEYSWWLRLGYLSSATSPITISAGESEVRTQVRRGLHSLFVNVKGSFDYVEVSGLAPGTAMCVDTVEVGDAVPEEGQ